MTKDYRKAGYDLVMVKKEVKDKLTAMRQKGESYNDVISKLIGINTKQGSINTDKGSINTHTEEEKAVPTRKEEVGAGQSFPHFCKICSIQFLRNAEDEASHMKKEHPKQP